VINAISNAITRGKRGAAFTSMELLLALKDAIDSDGAHRCQAEEAVVRSPGDGPAKEFYNRWVKEDVHRGPVRVLSRMRAQQLLEKYLDEIEASLDQRQVTDPMTGENRAPDERFPALGRGEDQGFPNRASSHSAQEVVAQGHGRIQGRREVPSRGAMRGLREAIEQYLFEERRDVLRLVTSTKQARRGGTAKDIRRAGAARQGIRLRRT